MEHEKEWMFNMCYYIAIEDLIANALIGEMEEDGEIAKRFFSYHELKAYGAKVISILMNRNEKAVLVLSREKTAHMLSDYSDYFEEREENGDRGIGLKDGIECGELISDIRGYLPLDVILAFAEARNPEFVA